MLVNGNPKIAKFGILGSVILGALVMSVWAWLVAVHAIRLYPSVVIVFPTVFLVNVLVIWRISHGPPSLPSDDVPIHRGLRRGMAIYTIACIIAIAYLIKEPNVGSASQVAIGMLVAGYVWYLIYRLKKFNQTQKGKDRPVT